MAVLAARVARHPVAGRTAFAKQPVHGPTAIGRLGLEGDEQGNRRLHGGPEKAVYCYAASNYPLWATELPDHATRFVAGGMGENLTVSGLDEDSVCLGDVVQIGSVRLQVSEPREPCNTLARMIGTPRVVKLMLRTARCGWYSRVLVAGVLSAGDRVERLERPNPGWTMRRVARLAADQPATPMELAELKQLRGVSPLWLARVVGKAAGCA